MDFKVLSLYFAFMSLNLFAGNGSSGEGHIYGDLVNPWFLQNTKQVSYCIDVDEDFSSLGFDKLNEVILKAINYWKVEFSDPRLDRHVNGDFFSKNKISNTKL